MTLFRQRYRVESTRLRDWDYAAAGWYFVTICAHQQTCFFGEVVDGEMQLSAVGEIVAAEWQRSGHLRPNIGLDQWVIMPNHLHGILAIKGTQPVETPRW